MVLSRTRYTYIVFILIVSMTTLAGGSSFSHDRFHRAWGAPYEPRSGTFPDGAVRSSTDMLQRWNQIAIDASGLDHTPVAPGEDRVFGENFGPGRASRAMAIVHIAIFEAVNAIAGRYESYIGLPRAEADTLMEAAIAQAAHDTLVALFPSQRVKCGQLLLQDLAQMPDGQAKANGIDQGRHAAAAILARRANDGAQHEEPIIGVTYFTSDQPGRWRQDPISRIPIALGARWAEVKPFVMTSAEQFRCPVPPSLSSPEYARAYDEVKRLGGDGITTPTERTEEQTFIGIYWAYDGTPSLCAPPRLYNQVAMAVAKEMGTDGDVVELARLLALVNVAMADAAIAIWESKYYYDYWRPVTGIREADPGTGPTGLGDGNPDTVGDPNFMPLGAPASNLVGPNFTPPFPAYPSGHAGFGGALFQTLRRFYGTDNISFTFVSDEFNGITRDNNGNIRPLRPRSYTSLSEAELENGRSRIYLGIHWDFDITEGILQGRRVADYVFDHVFLPRR
ncbi:MAG: phosphatase PAP2 family protein [Acidobacteriota bacterium]|nr:vanadium-dependent haloperoxidase [Blastocatellia bacterium]MDW8238880.1 phosphatase PAP2 family protein [Acidobacteriota bacterium]